MPVNAAHGGPENPHPTRRPVDINVMKRNMTIAKGFLDISLLSANANQLKNILNFGDIEKASYYIVLSGIITSLIFQLLAGVLLIIHERFDMNDDNESHSGDFFNNLIVALIFAVLIINVFVASFGVDIARPRVSAATPPSGYPSLDYEKGY
ncbi:ninjurin-1-like [Penaeus monodon]|uniref:ninjurin-1-like n=1 Tax=Penaeus monodon TaxID=6687 RepID=UPI0018A6D9AF|nr:ninjurin-1-like [Penaeus monodon]